MGQAFLQRRNKAAALDPYKILNHPSTILDEIMSWAALYLLRRIILTESMTVEFIKPVIIGETMEAGGGVLELKGRRDAIIEGVITNSAELDGGQLAAKLNRSFSFYFFLLSFK
jgi:hypothetical protein